MKYGEKTTPYKIGDPVYLLGSAKWGPGRVTEIHDDGTYSVKFCWDTNDCKGIKPDSMKPSTEGMVKRAEAKQAALEAEWNAKRKRQDDLMMRVAAAEPLHLTTAELIARGMENGLSFEYAIRRGEDELESALLFDNLSRNLTGVSYAGCKKLNYLPGDRVRYLGASRFGSKDVVPRGTLGIVFRNSQSVVLDVFKHSSMQPKGIMVQWDGNLGENFVYVTEVDPA